MSNFNKAIEEQLKLLIEAPRRRKKKKTEYKEPVSTSVPLRRITTGTGAGEGSGV